jgi:hypothetical protein
VSGWAGSILDAHDDAPIEGARVEVVWGRSFVGAKSLVRLADARGAFHIDPIPDWGPSAAEATLTVSAPHHASLVRVLPPPGRLTIALSTRRRALLARLVEVGARFRGGVKPDPTPDELARHAAEVSRGDVAAWARAVEGAAYGPDSIDQEREAAVSALEPRDV